MSTIYEFVKEQRDRSQTSEITDDYEFPQYERCSRLSCTQQQFTTGNKDSVGEKLQHLQIPRGRCHACEGHQHQVREDRKASSLTVTSFLLNLKNRNWMKQSNFPTFLDCTGFSRSKFGGVLVKRTEQKDRHPRYAVAQHDHRSGGHRSSKDTLQGMLPNFRLVWNIHSHNV